MNSHGNVEGIDDLLCNSYEIHSLLHKVPLDHVGLFDKAGIFSEHIKCVRLPEVSMDRTRIGYPAGYVRFFRIKIGFGCSFLKKIGSGYWFHFCNEIFLRVIQDVTNDGGSVCFLCYAFYIVSMCCTHHNQWQFVLLYR